MELVRGIWLRVTCTMPGFLYADYMVVQLTVLIKLVVIFLVNPKVLNRCLPQVMHLSVAGTSDAFICRHYQAVVLKQSNIDYQDRPQTTTIWWKVGNNKIFQSWWLENPNLKHNYLEWISCQCWTGCRAMRCKCKKGNLFCTDLCKCGDGTAQCMNSRQ